MNPRRRAPQVVGPRLMKRQIPRFDHNDPTDCGSCGEGIEPDDCPKSEKVCGHHCGHPWTHDSCCWCGQEFGEDPE